MGKLIKPSQPDGPVTIVPAFQLYPPALDIVILGVIKLSPVLGRFTLGFQNATMLEHDFVDLFLSQI